MLFFETLSRRAVAFAKVRTPGGPPGVQTGKREWVRGHAQTQRDRFQSSQRGSRRWLRAGWERSSAWVHRASGWTPALGNPLRRRGARRPWLCAPRRKPVGRAKALDKGGANRYTWGAMSARAWYANMTVWPAFTAWLLAQVTKLVTHWAATRKVDFRYLVRPGGMPSAHSAMASALATSVGLQEGFSSPLFAVTLAFAAVVMFDAQSVRRAAGQQARLLNQMVAEVFAGRPFPQQKLVEFIGHTPLEVFLGMMLGILVSVIFHYRFA